MYFLKSDINQFEHLITLLIFIGILLMISGHEANIVIFKNYIDNYLGFSSLDNKNTNILNLNLTSFNYDDIKHVLEFIIEWIIKDYESSQCRKWIKWINNKRTIIFSS
jgi:hypothetical protein